MKSDNFLSNSHMAELRCLFLQNNNIEVIDGLATFEHLTNLNLCSNYISKLDNLKDLPNLHTLLLSRNKLATADDIEELSKCKELGVLDLSYNSLNEPEVINVLERMPSLKVLTFMGNPIVRKTKEYRRMMILRLKHLTYLDTRPVRDEDRLCAQAWMEGGLEAERKLREKWADEKLQATKASVRNLMR